MIGKVSLWLGTLLAGVSEPADTQPLAEHGACLATAGRGTIDFTLSCLEAPAQEPPRP